MHMEQAEELMARLAAIRERMTRACEGKYPLPKVLAVTKTHTCLLYTSDAADE